jgi:hypothetical protein
MAYSGPKEVYWGKARRGIMSLKVRRVELDANAVVGEVMAILLLLVTMVA